MTALSLQFVGKWVVLGAMTLKAPFLFAAQEETRPPLMAGVVSYTDWSHVYLQSPQEPATTLDNFFGQKGIQKIIQTSRDGGISKLYWRTAGSAAAQYPSRFDTDGDGEPDLQTSSAYDFDFPSYWPIYRKEALTPDHLLLAPQSPDAPAVVRFKLPENGLAGSAVRLLAKVAPSSSGNESDGPFFYIGKGDGVAIGFPLANATKRRGEFRIYRVDDADQSAFMVMEGQRVDAVELPELRPAGQEVGIYWPAGCKTEVAVNALHLISSDRVERDPDALADRADLDLGPVISGVRDTSWQQLLAVENLSLKELLGDPLRRDNFARAYQSPHNPFGKGEDQISVAVREAHAAGMKICLWFTLHEENHYGSGPLSAFVRKHPQWREVDKDGNTWRARLSLAYPEVRRYKVAMVKEAVERYKPDGVLLDFVRKGLRDPYFEEAKTAHYPVRDEKGFSIFGYDPHSQKGFAEKYPSVTLPAQNSLPEWVDWRVANHTRLISELREAIPGVPVSVAVFSGSAEDSRRGDLLDWKYWAESGLIQEVMFILDNSTDGRPFIRPFGAPPEPVESVGRILAERKKELPKDFPMTAGIYSYKIKSDAIAPIVEEAAKGGAAEIAWWETASLEWAEGYSGKPWREIKRLSRSMSIQPQTPAP